MLFCKIDPKVAPHFRRKIWHLKTNAIFLTILPFREIHSFTCLIKYCYYNIMNLVCVQRQTFFRVFNFLCRGKMEFFSRIMPFSFRQITWLVQFSSDCLYRAGVVKPLSPWSWIMIRSPVIPSVATNYIRKKDKLAAVLMKISNTSTLFTGIQSAWFVWCDASSDYDMCCLPNMELMSV